MQSTKEETKFTKIYTSEQGIFRGFPKNTWLTSAQNSTTG